MSRHDGLLERLPRGKREVDNPSKEGEYKMAEKKQGNSKPKIDIYKVEWVTPSKMTSK